MKERASYKNGRTRESGLPPLAMYRQDYISEAKPSVKDERRKDKEVSYDQSREKDEGAPAPPQKTELTRVEAPLSKEIGKAEAPQEEKRREKEWAVKGKLSLITTPQREMTLRIADREKALSQLKELLKQYGGEVVKEEANSIFASLPLSSYSEFEKELIQMSSPPHSGQVMTQKDAKEDLSISVRAKRG